MKQALRHLGTGKLVAIAACAVIIGVAAAAGLPSLKAHPKRALPTSGIFDLAGPTSNLLHEKAMQDGTVLQSFAVDNVNQRLYTVQLVAGGRKLPGESDAPSSGLRSKDGDLALTELDFAGNKLGYMYLKNFGHGVQIGVENDHGVPYLWTETKADAEGGVNGWGTEIARFKFENGKVLTPDSPELDIRRPIEGADRTTVNIDAANGLLTMRYRLNGAFRFAVFDLESVKRGRYTPLADVPQPDMGTFQGFASYGGYLYVLEGDAYGAQGSKPPQGNTYITAVNLQTGKPEDKQLVSAGNTLDYREPEGLGIRIPNADKPDQAALCIGFASGFAPNRLANVYTFDRMQTLSNKNITAH